MNSKLNLTERRALFGRVSIHIQILGHYNHWLTKIHELRKDKVSQSDCDILLDAYSHINTTLNELNHDIRDLNIHRLELLEHKANAKKRSNT